MFLNKQPTPVATTSISSNQNAADIKTLSLLSDGTISTTTVVNGEVIDSRSSLLSEPIFDFDKGMLVLPLLCQKVGLPSIQHLAMRGDNIPFFNAAVELWNSNERLAKVA